MVCRILKELRPDEPSGLTGRRRGVHDIEAAPGGKLVAGVQHGRLADAGGAGEDQRAAGPSTGTIQQPLHLGQLVVPPYENHGNGLHRRCVPSCAEL